MPVKTIVTLWASAASITSWSRMEPPGWMTAVAPAAIAARRPSAKGIEGFRSNRRTLRQWLDKAHGLGSIFRLLRSDAGRVHAAHLTGADTGRLSVLGIDHGIRLDVLGDLEGKLHVFQFLRRRCTLGDDFQIEVFHHAVVTALDQ